MQLFADTDLVVFLCTVAQILLFGPFQLRKNLPRFPQTLDIEVVPHETLGEAHRKYLQSYDDKLAKLNYWPTITYRAANFGRNLLRSYVNPTEPVRCVLMMVEVPVNVNGVRSTGRSSTLEFFTHFTDDSILVTRNMRLKTVFENLPNRVMQECPRISDPAELRRRHMVRLQELNRSPKSPASSAESVFKEFQQSHQRFCSYQLERGNLQTDATGTWYSCTSKVHWRGIFNFLNPFGQRFSAKRFVPAALSGVALPVVASLFLAPAVAHSALVSGLSEGSATNLVMLGSYLLAGAAVGFLLQKSNFLWTFIFTYLGVGVIVGFHPAPFPYSTVAALVAYGAAQLRKVQPPLPHPKARSLISASVAAGTVRK